MGVGWAGGWRVVVSGMVPPGLLQACSAWPDTCPALAVPPPRHSHAHSLTPGAPPTNPPTHCHTKQGLPKKSKRLPAGVDVKLAQPDPTLLACAFQRQRLYLFTQREPEETDNAAAARCRADPLGGSQAVGWRAGCAG